MEWTKVSVVKPKEIDWVQVLVIIQEYINLGCAGIVGQSQHLEKAMFHPINGFYINGELNTNVTHWCYPPAFPDII